LKEQDRDFPSVWQLLMQQGVRTGVFGSLHTYPPPQDMEQYDFYVPDTFAAGSECFPKNIELFQEFSLGMARESGRNVSKRVNWTGALQLLANAPGLGFKLSTFADVGQQLLSERKTPWQRSRRRSYQSVLAFDVFMKQLESKRPSFATFFSNHVASSMHRYWAAAFPGDYQSFGCTEEWVETFAGEIDFTMGKFDEFLRRLVRFSDTNPEYQIWVTTSMGQAATVARACESQLYLMEPEKFMQGLGVGPADWEQRPAMLPQCNVVVREGLVDAFRAKLKSLTIDGAPSSYREAENGFFSLDFGQEGLGKRRVEVRLGDRELTLAELGLKTVEIEDKSWTSAYHVPNGSLLIYDPMDAAAKPEATQVSTIEIAPTLLQNFAVRAPDYMRAPVSLAGSSPRPMVTQ
jgi:hypothetical protein